MERETVTKGARKLGLIMLTTELARIGDGLLRHRRSAQPHTPTTLDWARNARAKRQTGKNVQLQVPTPARSSKIPKPTWLASLAPPPLP